MTTLRFARQLMLLLAATTAMLLGACRDDGVVDPPKNDSCCAVIKVAVTTNRVDAHLGGVQVALRKGMDVIATKTTNDDGIATFAHVCNGQYNLRLTKDGYSVAERGEIVISKCDTTLISVNMSSTNGQEPGDTCCNSVLRIIPTDQEGTPIAGAQVKITGPNGQQRVVESTHDGATFREVCHGAWMIRIFREGFQVNESRIEIGCGSEKTVRIALHRGGEDPSDSCCHGRLFVAPRDTMTAELLQGAVVKVWRNGQIIRTQIIQDRPAAFDGLCKGHYGISIHREGYRPVEAEFEMRCDGEVEITKYLSRVDNGGDCCRNTAVIRVLDAATRQPVANALVSIRRSGAVVQSVRANADGVAKFFELCAGEYGVVAEHDRYHAEDMHINVVCGQVTEATIALRPENTYRDSCANATIKVTVLRGNSVYETPIAGVTVVIKTGDRQVAIGETNDDGVYMRGELWNRHTYVVVFEKAGYQRLAIEIPIEECVLVQRTVRLIPN